MTTIKQDRNRQQKLHRCVETNVRRKLGKKPI
jgi:hypothetical protein